MATVAPRRISPQHGAVNDWRLGFRSLEAEHRDPVELEVDGTLPPGLAGTLYRIGPARHDVYGSRYRHWFDGDGMVHAIRLSGGRVTYRNRFVATPKKLAEDAARRRLYGGFGSTPAGSPLERLRRWRAPNVANINVVSHGGRLLALWEQGRPFRLHPDTLETLGEETLGMLGEASTFSAHPKLHPHTGDLWNFGVHYRENTLRVYRCRAGGRSEVVAGMAMPFPAMVHDFAITATHAIFVFPPLTLPRIPVSMLLGLRSYDQVLRWRPRLGTRIATFDLERGTWRMYATEPFLFFHVVNAWDEDGSVVVDICTYPDDRVMSLFPRWMRGRNATALGRPERLELTENGAVRRAFLGDALLEFPRVDDADAIREHTRLFGVGFNQEGEFIGEPTMVLPDGSAQSVPMGRGRYAGELVPVAKPGARGGDDAWLLTMVLDATRGQSELWVLDSADLSAPPVVVPLPHAVPFGLHGNWVADDRHG